MTLFNTLRTAAAKRAEYNRTRREIAALPPSLAADLGLAREDADKIARRAVYG